MKAKIGYFLPQFLGQTHIFYWREQQFLAELGIETDLVSTQLPPRALVSHVWVEEAKKNTVYLFPFAAKDFINSFVEVLKAGTAAWWQCLTVIAKARDTSLSKGFAIGIGFYCWQTSRVSKNNRLVAHPRSFLCQCRQYSDVRLITLKSIL